jgi:hypothetical protein
VIALFEVPAACLGFCAGTFPISWLNAPTLGPWELRNAFGVSSRGREVWDTIFSKEGGLAMLDEDVMQILIGSTAMIIFALALVYFQRL